MSDLCTGKHKYPSMQTARLIARQQNRRDGRTIAAYRCRDCRCFHVGSKNGPTLRRTDSRARPERPQDFRPDNEYDRRRR